MMEATVIYDKVRDHYGSIAKSTGNDQASKIAQAFGYTVDDLASIPKDANLGLSCGNPLILAKLQEGETIVDLGSGAGFDVFLAAKAVGPTGKAIGVDMNKDMLERANRNKQQAKADNVSFVESPITEIDLPNQVADCIISNCVINLVPAEEKQLVFNEMFRLLKPGGRVAVSDILLKKELPRELKEDLALYVGCIAGASKVTEYERYLQQAGFCDVLIVDNRSDLNVYSQTDEHGEYSGCCGVGKDSSCSQASPCCPSTEQVLKPEDVNGLTSHQKVNDFNEWAGSFKIYAVKA